MDRAFWRKLADDRVDDARVLLAGDRWSVAYHVAGYAVECGLKACVLAYLETHIDIIFREKRFSEKCWTHELKALVELAALDANLEADMTGNPILRGNWGVAKDWKETSRYEEKTEREARTLFEAVTNEPNGVLRWIRGHW